MRQFSFLIKPASADCNLQCPYCFYLDRCHLYPETKKHRMSDEVLEKMVSSFMGTGQRQYAFCWQGGEPTLMGVDFFRRVTELQKKYGKTGDSVANSLQTNATIIDDDFARHFAEYNYLIGVSLDGPKDVHDGYRRYASGRGSYDDVVRGIERLKEHAVAFNILTLVTSANAGRAKEVYRYLSENGYLHHQYIPCVEFNEKNKPLPFAISAEDWGDFLCEIFDMWYPKDTRRISVRLFDSILNLMIDGVRSICRLGKDCCQYLVVEYNGDVYPCDFFVEKGLKLGNIMDASWQDMLSSPAYIEFGKKKAEWNEKCSACDFIDVCAGDCLKHRLYANDDPRTLSWLCEGWEKFFRHSLEDFKKLAGEAREEHNRRRLAESARMRHQTRKGKIGRNAPCPCGSGKKFKNCCGA